jgi:hypothetical protein
VADDFDPAPVFELLQDQRIDGHAADVFHVTARHRLAVGDDGQRFQHGPRVLGRLFGVQAVEVLAHLRAALEAPAAGDVHQFDPALGPVVLKVREQRLDGVGSQFVVEQDAQLANRQRLLRANQGGFEDALGIRRIHGLAVPGKRRHRRANQGLNKAK